MWFGSLPETIKCNGKTLRIVKENHVGVDKQLFANVCDGVAVAFGDFNPMKFEDDLELRRAFAEHEAFHAAVQVAKYDAVRRAVSFESKQPLGRDDLGVVQNFFKRLGQALKTQRATCSVLSNERQRLSDTEWQSANIRARFEWTADYYMSRTIGQSEIDFLRFRTEKVPFADPADWVYLSGFYAMREIEKTYSRIEWQGFYTQGLSPLQLLYVVKGCDSIRAASSTEESHRFYAASDVYQ